jgi:hypothetical protein
MEETKDGPNVEGGKPADHGLEEELESLYRRVAQVDQPDASVEKSVDDTHGGDKDVADLPRRADPRENLPTREILLERLMAIQDAYERILTYWPYTLEHPPRLSGKEEFPPKY